jgi:hypothetical protein
MCPKKFIYTLAKFELTIFSLFAKFFAKNWSKPTKIVTSAPASVIAKPYQIGEESVASFEDAEAEHGFALQPLDEVLVHVLGKLLDAVLGGADLINQVRP